MALIAAAPNALASASASAAGSSFVSFSTFMKTTAGARYSTFQTAGHAAAVRSPQAFSQMRSYIVSTYRGVKVEHSFVLGGTYFDCVTVKSQPTVRDLRLARIAAPPAAAPAGHRGGKAVRSLLARGLRDRYGNAISCPAGTMPMLRMTLGAMTRFPTLAAFLAKGPAGAVARTIPPGSAHRYAYGYQRVTNYGGNSWLNVWNPSGPFTLSQQWYVNGSGSGTQTVEGGWVHYPAKFGTKSVLFIFSTPNNYASGCYNLECPGFVQTSSAATLGAPFNNYSTYGGTQWGFGLQWKYYNGNWWMYYSGNAVGYYPGSVFKGGPMASKAALTEYGGETYTSGTSWPQMGSGKFAKAGFSQAAYQNTIFYIPKNESGGTGVWSSLTTVQTNPTCYTIKYTPASQGGSWGTYFYFGGPGGKC
ncbi:MAG: neprosin family prolyl endopeptidase [Streptosporangiaceae bacterium]